MSENQNGNEAFDSVPRLRHALARVTTAPAPPPIPPDATLDERYAHQQELTRFYADQVVGLHGVLVHAVSAIEQQAAKIDAMDEKVEGAAADARNAADQAVETRTAVDGLVKMVAQLLGRLPPR